MKNKIQTLLTFFLIFVFSVFSGIGITKTVDGIFGDKPDIEPVFIVETGAFCETTIPPAPVPDAEFITGPLAAEVGELCIFRLNDPKTRADWVVIRQIDKEPPATFYIDSAGSALTFSSNIAAKYTIVAAIVQDGSPRILQHICQYGTTPNPSPDPEPNPTPEPQPEPVTLTDWVRQNIPEAGKPQAAALASCYESASTAIEKGSIKTPEAAFSAIRTNTQTKIKIDVWKDFLDTLSEKITVELGETKDIKELGAIFIEIANGLKPIVAVETDFPVKPRPTTQAEQTVQKPVSSQSLYCSDPTGQACQPQPVRVFPGLFQGGRR